MAFKAKTVAITVHPKHWDEFTKLAADQGQTASAFLRLLVAKELRQAAKDAQK